MNSEMRGGTHAEGVAANANNVLYLLIYNPRQSPPVRCALAALRNEIAGVRARVAALLPPKQGDA